MIRYLIKLYKADEYVRTICKSKPNEKVLPLTSKHKNANVQRNANVFLKHFGFYKKTKCGCVFSVFSGKWLRKSTPEKQHPVDATSSFL